MVKFIISLFTGWKMLLAIPLLLGGWVLYSNITEGMKKKRIDNRTKAGNELGLKDSKRIKNIEEILNGVNIENMPMPENSQLSTMIHGLEISIPVLEAQKIYKEAKEKGKTHAQANKEVAKHIVKNLSDDEKEYIKNVQDMGTHAEVKE